jgi:methionyl aminopeptidase
MRPKTPADIENMRQGGKLLATILQDLAAKVKPGVTPKELSADAAAQIKKYKMQPVVLGHDGFPDVMCISVNQTIVHGVPSNDPIEDGDVVKLDLTLGYKGMINDSALTVLVGQADAAAKRLVEGTKKSLQAGIAAVKGEGTRVGDIILMKDGSLGAHFEHTVLITNDSCEILTLP